MSAVGPAIEVTRSQSILKPPPGAEIQANRTLVVDDSSTILHMICTLLEHHKLVEVVGKAETALQAIDAVRALSPDLVLMDAELSEMSGLRTALVVSEICPATRIILMTMEPLNTEAGKHFRAACAAHAVIYKPRFLNELAVLLEKDLVRPHPAA